MRRVNFRISLEAATGSGTGGGGGGGEEGDGNRQLDGERQEAANQFYPLQELLQEAVKQEKLVWKKTKGVRLNPNGIKPFLFPHTHTHSLTYVYSPM